MLCVILISMVGCSAGKLTVSNYVEQEDTALTSLTKDSNNMYSLKFKDMVKIDTLKEIQGEKVTINGFLAASSPLDGRYAYLMNIPYQTCAFCVPNDEQLVNTLAIYPEKGKTIDFTERPVKIEGTLVFDTLTDSQGYTYDYYLKDVKVVDINIDGLEDEIRTYTAIIDKGYATTFASLMSDLYAVINYEEFEGTSDILKPIQLKKIDELDAMFEGLDKEEYVELLQINQDLRMLALAINENIAKKDYVALKALNENGQKIYNDFQYWLSKPEF